MTRIPGNTQIQVRPRNDMLTALLGAAVVAAIIAIVAIVVRSYTIFDGLF